MPKNNLQIFLLIIVLAGLAIGLGYSIYRKPAPPSPSVQSTIPPPQPTVPDEVAVLNFPGPDASDEEKQKHAAIVARLAKPGTTLNITGCQPDPLVLEMKVGTPFTVINNDPAEHTIIRDQDTIITIPGNSTKKITEEISLAFFEKGPGTYGYVCDTVRDTADQALVGIFLLL